MPHKYAPIGTIRFIAQFFDVLPKCVFLSSLQEEPVCYVILLSNILYLGQTKVALPPVAVIHVKTSNVEEN